MTIGLRLGGLLKGIWLVIRGGVLRRIRVELGGSERKD